ncbi:MAG: Asp23/Gls24 family envelope stress response protein [Dermatophilaceae bacterium]
MADARPTILARAPEERGSLVIANKVVERVATIAAREIGQVTDSRAGWTQMYRNLPTATAKVAGGRARVNVEVAAAWPSSLPEVTAQVRDRVSERVTNLTGVTVVAVDVTVADVIRLETDARRVR